MPGQFYVYSFSVGSDDVYDDVPLQLNIKVAGLKERKRSELYSVIFDMDRS